MSWNYRVFRQERPGEELVYDIREAYYDSKDNVTAWTGDAVGVSGETTEELREALKLMLESLDKPVVDI